ncbi:MAG TPA: carbamoyltransferase HypF [Casimicrobiaceae bacterium]|nr:carbamoyltransferase HypF [Casimicrobiaceae bacterium]
MRHPASPPEFDPPVQRRLRVRGVVQGVGFRPFVWHLARELGLRGWVRNDPSGVDILLQGDLGAVGAFTGRLESDRPGLARIDSIIWEDQPPAAAMPDFSIAPSEDGSARTMIGHDTAVCAACLQEMFDPRERRWRYAFTNCTHCGPRYTITRALPYDRARTSMAAFPMCRACATEYADPADRRFHAEPIACPSCGPQLDWVDARGHPIACDDPVAAAVAALRAGSIVAIKGLGGFHLACNARNAASVRRLRERKHREQKPFALMVANGASARQWVWLDEPARRQLEAPERPIVLLDRRPEADAGLPGVADGMACLGVMLPYAPLHYLIFHEFAGRPAGTAWLERPNLAVLVMTSANPGGEPLVADNAEAVARLGGIADAMLVHDRVIAVPCDDSVVQATGHGERFVRRARGYTPRAIRLDDDGPAVLALGADLKDTVCVTRGAEAFVSQHIGTLDNAATRVMLEDVVAHLLDLGCVKPQAIAHDLHPDFASTRHALALAERFGVPCIAVQHHHAHIAAVVAEHRHRGPVLGLALDGTGMGTDGGAWGGELLRVDGGDFRRLAHLAPLALPGGDRAAREPWRMAAAALARLGRVDEIPRRFPRQAAAPALARWLGRDPAMPLTTSLGRCFDAAAALLGLCEVMDFEAQAAMRLEAAARACGPAEAWPDGYRIGPQGLDLLPALSQLPDASDVNVAAARFHATVATALATWAADAADQHGIDVVVLGGGCFLNIVLATGVREGLAQHGLRVLEARAVPPNDGGLCLGQAHVARRRLGGVH